MGITMCKGNNCPVKKECTRYTANQSIMQSWFVEEPFEIKDGKFTCDMCFTRLVDLETIIFGL